MHGPLNVKFLEKCFAEAIGIIEARNHHIMSTNKNVYPIS